MEKNLQQIVEDNFYEQKKQLMTLLAGNPEFLQEGAWLKKFPVEEVDTEEGKVFTQNILIVPASYKSEESFEAGDKKYPSATLRLLVKI